MDPEQPGARTRAEVQIYGETYIIRGDNVSEEYVQRLAASVDERMRELAQRNPALSITRVAVLAALNLADELWNLREQHRLLLGAFERRLDALETTASAGGRHAAGRRGS